MIRFVNMPLQLPCEESPVIIAPCVKVGERIRIGDIVLTYSHDGAVFEERACISGEVIAVFFKKNDAVSGGCPVVAVREERCNG